MNSPLSGKVAVITGASRGIGAAIAEALAVRSCDLVLAGRDLARLTDVADSVGAAGIRALPYVCDVRDETAVARMFATVKEEFGRLDILINNAGVAQPICHVADFEIELFREVIETNLVGPFLCTRAALPLMPRGAFIVNNLSIAAVMSFPGFSAYDASKRGLLGFTNSLREELRERGIRVLALIPGATATDLWNQFMPQADRATMMQLADVAAAVVNALEMPEGTVVEEIRMLPISGTTRK